MSQLAAWYQKKIGTYDKQEWETTLERCALRERRQVPLESARLRSDLIDVDLVRGSSFPKAKPVQAPGTVLRLASARILFFPLWRDWWSAHTSGGTARIFLCLWTLQLVLVVLYLSAPVSLDSSRVLVPLLLVCGLGTVHALMVSTDPAHGALSGSLRRETRSRLAPPKARGRKRRDPSAAEDDGFESLNGNNSNGSENGERRPRPVEEPEPDPARASTLFRRAERRREEAEASVDSDDRAPSSEEDRDPGSSSPGVRPRRPSLSRVRDDSRARRPHYEPHSESESEREGLEGDSSWEPFSILNPANDRVFCAVWENGNVLKARMSAVEISHAVVRRAESTLNENAGGLWSSASIAAVLAAAPSAARLLQAVVELSDDQTSARDLPALFLYNSPGELLSAALGSSAWERATNLVSLLLRFGYGTLVFFLLAVARRSFGQRFLYAKLFSHLTSARRARQSLLPHFRLNRVRNIKAWLSVRSYLMRRGPQRSVEVIVSGAFVLLILSVSSLVVDLLQDQSQVELSRTAETLGWTVALGSVLLRLAALSARAARKHRCLPVLLTEQINLHLAMERSPAGKERLSVANNVLKLAADLLKELDGPFRISGLSGNPYLYTITKVVVLSALSGVLSDLLGFKLKLHKIKIK